MYLVFILLLVMCDEREAAETYTVTEGRDVSVTCKLEVTGDWMVFCKNDCKDRRNVLIETTDVVRVSGRYSVYHTKHRSNSHTVRVGIRDTRLSDTGLYSCGVEKWTGVIKEYYYYEPFFIKVVRAVVPTSAALTLVHKETSSSPPAQTQEHTTTAPSGLTVRPSSLFYNDSTSSPPEQQQQNSASVVSGVLHCVCWTLAAVVSLVYITLFTLYWKREHNTSQAAAAEGAHTTEMDDPGVVIYAEVSFAGSSNSAPRCQPEPVIYAVPRVHCEEASLYSTIKFPS